MADRMLSRTEQTADAVVHLAGILASLVAVPLLIAVYWPTGTAGMSVALAIYGVSVITLFCASAANNMLPVGDWTPLLQRIDHAAIYLKIAGTYTPLVVLMGGLYAYAVLVMVWVGAVAGAALRLLSGDRFGRLTVALSLALGWASVVILWVMFERLPFGAALLVVAGGVLYSIGVIFHVWQRLLFQRAIWHGFVLAASSCHFCAVAWSCQHLAA